MLTERHDRFIAAFKTEFPAHRIHQTRHSPGGSRAAHTYASKIHLFHGLFPSGDTPALVPFTRACPAFMAVLSGLNGCPEKIISTGTPKTSDGRNARSRLEK
jgi:hypothetical protein